MIKQLLIDKLSNEINGARDYYLNDDERATIVECIEKQIPKKPKGDFHSVPHHRCPTCNCAIRLYEKDSHDLFCKFCGQAIDWSDNE